jgi:hypothetical protein
MTDESFAEWLRRNPAPDLQKLVEQFGGYDKITPEAWQKYDADMEAWQGKRREETAR